MKEYFKFEKVFSNIKKLTNNAVVGNLFLVGFLTLLIKFLGFYKETFIAKYLGLSLSLDTFILASLIPAFINNVFVTSFKNVFIPNYVVEINTKNNVGSFQTIGFCITAVICLFFASIAFITTDYLLEILFPGHEKSYYDLVRQQFYYVFPCIFLWGFSSLLGGLLNVGNEFKFASLGGIFTPIAIILCLIFSQRSMGSNVLAIGTLIGASSGFLYFVVISKIKKVLTLSKPNFQNKNVRVMIKQLPAKMTSSLLTGLLDVTDSFFAAQLIVGSLSALSYAKKIPAFAVGIIIVALSNVLLPHFSKKVISDKNGAFKTLFKFTRLLFIATVVISILGIMTSTFFVELFFEKNEFTKEDTLLVASIQKIFLLYIPFKICGTVLVNFITSINKNNFLALVSLISVVLNVVFNIFFIQYYGLLGIAISTTLVVAIRSFLLFGYVIKHYKVSHS